MKEKSKYLKPEYLENRELSWLQFNKRILAEAKDKSILLFERMKFLSITASNLDEFFMIRIASLMDMVHAGYTKQDIAGMTPGEQLDAILPEAKAFMAEQYKTLNRQLLPQMEKNGLKLIRSHEELNSRQAAYVDEYFVNNIYPVLTPMAVDQSRPFPLIQNKSLNIGALIKDKKRENVVDIATVQVPSVLPRIIEIPSEEENNTTIILLEEVIERNLDKLFLNYTILSAHPYRVMRNADLTIDEEDAADLLKEIEKQIKRRQWGEVIRLEVADSMDKRLQRKLMEQLKVDENYVYKIKGPLDLTFLMKAYGLDGFDAFKLPKFTPQPVPGLDRERGIFEQIREHDILLHHPYYEFTPVVDFISQAANDPNVLAIKQTLYRVSGNSPIVASLARAAENGKQVTVLVELKARFDEENNIGWAKMLEKAGCHVIYGLVGLKTHSKIALVVRREEDGIRRYVHLGTGNYNDVTAKLYTDMGLLTCNDAIGEDATAVFNMLSGYSEPPVWNKLMVAPIWLKDRFLMLIDREAENARKGKKARIVAKMNSLCDPAIIEALYRASAAGVKIDLIIRGICCLKTGIPEISENVTVRSIVGNFLEHSRIFYFYNEGFEDVYMGSADWMPRNLDKRVEITFPIEDEQLKRDVIGILKIQLNDTLKAHILQPDGREYAKQDLRGLEKICAQDEFCRLAMEKAYAEEEDAIIHNVFEPATAEK
ncbi:MAG: RNA degradosome polyphosphate kinase [Bacteroidales bacterium]|nr:RNA degradosome polyphosphate kinase [Clostridium sp.]MCM1203178.1 RNA degradosome polyphosphate kinase [Bacteroidales bacterium]